MEIPKKYAGILLLFLAGGLLLMPSTAELHGFDGWHPKHPPAPPEGWPDTAVEKPDFSAGSSWSDSQRDMLYQLRQSSLLLDSSLLDVMQALKMDPALISNRQMLYNNLKSSDTDLGFLQASSEADVPAEQMQSAARKILDSGDEATLAELDQSIRRAETKRVLAGVYLALAARDAISVIGKAADGTGNRGWSVWEGLFSTVWQTRQLLQQQNHQNSQLKEALADYRAARNIRTPSQKEAQQAMEGWKPE